MQTYSLHPCVVVSLVWEGTLQDIKTENWTPTEQQNLLSTTCPASKLCWGNGREKLVGLANPCIVFHEGHNMSGSTYSMLPGVQKTETWDRTKYEGNEIIERIPNDFLLYSDLCFVQLWTERIFPATEAWFAPFSCFQHSAGSTWALEGMSCTPLCIPTPTLPQVSLFYQLMRIFKKCFHEHIISAVI